MLKQQDGNAGTHFVPHGTYATSMLWQLNRIAGTDL